MAIAVGLQVPGSIDQGILFSGNFTDTSQKISDPIFPSADKSAVSIFVAPVGVAVTVAVDIMDEAGAWHPAPMPSGYSSTADGTTDIFNFRFRAPLRVKLTPASGVGSCVAWGKCSQT